MHRLLQFFKWDHLPEHLQEVSKLVGAVAQALDTLLPETAEKTTGLRKLLEAKDCFVRSLLEK